MTSCIECFVGHHWRCLIVNVGLCCCKANDIANDSSLYSSPPVGQATVKDRGGQIKSSKSITDITSTGRKRAAMIWPTEIMDKMICQWAGLKYAGGGVEPIIGCNPQNPNPAKHRHHGPDKNVVNNTPFNLHVICTYCHGRWHTKNDKYYEHERPAPELPYVPLIEYKEHDPNTKATLEEIATNEINWNIKIKDRVE